MNVFDKLLFLDNKFSLSPLIYPIFLLQVSLPSQKKVNYPSLFGDYKLNLKLYQARIFSYNNIFENERLWCAGKIKIW